MFVSRFSALSRTYLYLYEEKGCAVLELKKGLLLQAVDSVNTASLALSEVNSGRWQFELGENPLPLLLLCEQ